MQPQATSRPTPAPLERLGAASRYRLTLLVAPPGSGKTRLLREWQATRPEPVAWLDLTPGDNEPQHFLARLGAAATDIGLALSPVAPASAETDLLDAVAAWINDLAAVSFEFYLVFDNYQAITAPGIHEAVALLLDYLPPRLHVIIANQAEPPLPLPRLRVRRQLLILGTAEIAEPPRHNGCG